jgi:hypothetical protein
VLTSVTGEKQAISATTVNKRKRRPHVLKIDVEGHDFEVLMSFINDEKGNKAELPLLIDFEAKSIASKYPIAKSRMEEM